MAEDLIELMAPAGCDEANHGTERYRVDNSGRIFVSREAAHWLVRCAGFKHPRPTFAGAAGSPDPVQATCGGQIGVPRPEPPRPLPPGGELLDTAPQADGDGAEAETDPRRVPRR